MVLRMAIIFKRKTVNFEGKDHNVFKPIDITVGGYGENDKKQWLFASLYSFDTILVINESNILKHREDFKSYKYYAGMISENDFFNKYHVNEEYDYDLAKEDKLKEWDGFYFLTTKGKFQKITDNKFLDEINKVFKMNNTTSDTTELDKSKNLLKKYGTFLTDKEYLFNPAIGREEEIKRLEMALLSYDTNGILVGDAGVGKTAIVEGLAYKIKNGLVHDKLKDIEIISISSTSMVSGTRYVGDMEKRMLEIIDILKHNKKIIMFVDEVHTLIGAGQGSKSNLDVANVLKPYIDKGDIKIISSTTEEEYENIITDSAFKSRFKKIKVCEPDNETLKSILDGVIGGLEKKYNIKFNFEEFIKDKIYDLLIKLTGAKNRDYKDKINNPRLILSIVKDMFSSALYNQHENILVDDIVFAINECDRIYDSVRNMYIIELKKLLNIESVLDSNIYLKVLKL